MDTHILCHGRKLASCHGWANAVLSIIVEGMQNAF